MEGIGFTGLAGAGKTTAAKWFEKEHGFQLISIADPLKEICRDLFLASGRKEELRQLYQHPSMSAPSLSEHRLAILQA